MKVKIGLYNPIKFKIYLERTHADKVWENGDDSWGEAVLSHEPHLEFWYANDLISFDLFALTVPIPARNVEQLFLSKQNHHRLQINSCGFLGLKL